MLYIWTRRNPDTEINMVEVFTFRAQYLPWVVVLFIFFFQYDPTEDFIGYAVGHLYYFLVDVIPYIPETKGVQVLRPPQFLTRFCQWLQIHDFTFQDEMSFGQRWYFEDEDQDGNGGQQTQLINDFFEN